MDLDRFAEGTPDDDASGDATVCVVATQPDTLQRCREGFYRRSRPSASGLDPEGEGRKPR